MNVIYIDNPLKSKMHTFIPRKPPYKTSVLSARNVFTARHIFRREQIFFSVIMAESNVTLNLN